MDTYSKKQIQIWQDSTVTFYEDGYSLGASSLGNLTLYSLFTEGFTPSGKDCNGNMCLLTAAGREIAIHSKSLAKALRKLYKQHVSERWYFARFEIEKLMLKKEFSPELVKVMLDGEIGFNPSDKDASEQFILSHYTTAERWIFVRHTWCSSIEFVKSVKKK